MKLKPIILATSFTTFGLLMNAQADYQYLGTPTASWVAYNNGTLPTLTTTTPGSITASGSGFTFKYARSSDAAGAFNTATGIQYNPGDALNMGFTGSVGSGVDFRIQSIGGLVDRLRAASEQIGRLLGRERENILAAS